MTNTQKKKVEEIRQNWTQLCNGEKYAEGHEVKRFEVEECQYFVSVVLVVGLKGDEGTMAEIFARSSVHLFIYKGGRVTYPVSRYLKNGKHEHGYRSYKGDLWRVYWDQEYKCGTAGHGIPEIKE